jgi:chorismate mutase
VLLPCFGYAAPDGSTGMTINKCLRRTVLSFLSMLLLSVSPVGAASPSVSAKSGVSTPEVTAGEDPLPYLHHNYFQRVGTVMVNNISRPIYLTSRAPILRDRREYRVVRYDPVYETKIVNVYGERAVTVRVGTRSEPVYATRTVRQIEGWRNVPVWDTRTVRQIEGWRNVPVWGTRQECVDRFRGRCLQYRTVRYVARYISEPIWGTTTERYVARYISEPIWRTTTERYVAGYTSEPIYETRIERYVKDTVTLRQQVGTTPVMEWVKVCSLCEIEGYKETKVLTGYEQTPVEQLVGPQAELMRCRAAGPNGDCGAKSRRFHNGSWWEYVGHADSYTPRGSGSRGPAGSDDCPPGQIRTLDGTTCIIPEETPVTVCRFNGVLYVAFETRQSSVFPTDRQLLNGTCDEWNKTVSPTTTIAPSLTSPTTLPGVESPPTTLPGVESPPPTLPGVESPPTTLPGEDAPATTAPRRPVSPS